MADPRLQDPRFADANNGGAGRLRLGAGLLRSDEVVVALRAGAQFPIPADSDWRGVGGACDCGRPVEWNVSGLEWPVCEECMTGAVECLRLLDGHTEALVA